MDTKAFEFGPFQFDATRLELRRRGLRMRLSASRLRLLLLFLTQPGKLMTREEVAACLWKDGQNVDTIAGTNTAIKDLRTSLGDDSVEPKYIETVIGAGYRFIAKVTEIAPAGALAATSMPAYPTGTPSPSIAADRVTAPEAGISAPDAAHAAAEPGTPQLGGVAGPLLPMKRLRWKSGAYFVVTVGVLAGLGLAFISRWHGSATEPDSDLQLARVTLTGDIQSATISPDGHFIVTVRATAGRTSLWITQPGTGRVLPLANFGSDICPGADFSPDGSYVYFVRLASFAASGKLFRIPVLGGDAVPVLEGASGAPALSPDGRKVAFVHSTLPTHGIDSVVVAGVDGSDSRVLVSYPAPGIHLNRLTWAANGELLAYVVNSSLVVLPAKGGTPRPVGGTEMVAIDDLWGLTSSPDLLVAGLLSGSPVAQLYIVPLSGGPARAITHDLSNYLSVRATADGRSLLAVENVRLATVQTMEPGKEQAIHQISASNQTLDGVLGVAWTLDGRIVYPSQWDRNSALSIVDSNGSNARRLKTFDSSHMAAYPAASPLGGFLVFSEWSAGDHANVWRVEMKDGSISRLTGGNQDFPSSVTADGAWIVYGSISGDKPVLMKVASHGGAPIQLTNYNSDHPAVSPDGAWIACSYSPQSNHPPQLALVPIAGGQPAKTFLLPASASPFPLAWSPDGMSIAYINQVDGVDNIWRQPLAGGAPAPVTRLDSGRIFSFDWSRDGRLALSRGSAMTDAVLIGPTR